ncbi:MAG: MBL fold metallo-hydrolase [Gammaproteobacteria bacterium]|nr:MBL fold metallo-hydrolase [Gammaproteobacteria bacterium]MCF6261397.1 MBL fold metallo-hydrolase [Gammaproteobacteria bacterium]
MKVIKNVKFFIASIMLLSILTITTNSLADENALELQKVSDNVYALVGKRGPMTEKDLGTNATFGVVITRDSVVLIDPGASFKGAQRIHAAIKSITDKPVKLVINTGSEDHRWLGNGYFKQQGAKIIAATAAVENQKERSNDLHNRLDFLIKEDGAKGTQAVYADETFAANKEIVIGGTTLQLMFIGPAYTPGDTMVWLPKQHILFAGNVITVERIPAVGSMSKTAGWIKAFEHIAAHKPTHIIPGHGHVTDIKQARADTLNYLLDLRKGIMELIDNGGTLDEVSKVDQSKFKKLIGYEMLKGRNANQVFQELEWE